MMQVGGVVLVTGAGSGIGKEVARRLTYYGAKVMTAETCKNLKRPGDLGSPKTAAHGVDVRDETSVSNLVDEVARTYGRIDVLVNTAGFGAANQTPIRDMSLADWRSLDEVHNIGCFLLTRAVLRVMDKQVLITPVSTFGDRPSIRGAIVMVTSLASEGTFWGVGNYIAAKHAVKGMGHSSQCCRPIVCFGSYGGRVFAASPEVKNVMLGDLPMKRLVGPGEVADVVAFLASSVSSYVNGHTLVVDGGASLPLSNSPF
ncbi:3-oxoacyl-reductase [Xylaria venustula]|nr:3-oxoacyl-reductase [Xylaria venustula]